MKLLITDIFLRKTFDVVNILKLHYHPNIFVYTCSDVSLSSIIRTRLFYQSTHLRRLRNGDNFNQDLAEIVKCYKDEVLVYIPIEESTTLEFLRYLKTALNQINFNYLLPDLDTFSLSRNKEALNLFCESNDIASPTYISEYDFRSRNFKFPIIKKPKHGMGAKGIDYIEDEKYLNDLSIDFDKYFLQERLPNPDEVEGGFFLCKNGEVMSFYSHKRIRTYPESGGVTVFSKCGDSLEIKFIGEKIIQKLNWSGFLMIEFLFDPRDKKYKLIEINPRLYGSVLLSEFCGADFLRGYVNMCLGENVSIPKINPHAFIRWSFPYDIMYWIKNPSNPFVFFRPQNNTCYINFTYSTYLNSFLFILLTYIDFKKIRQLFKNG